MKKSTTIIEVLLFLFTFSAYGQTPLTYTEVVKVDSVYKNELYKRAKLWFVETYNSSKDVLQLDSKEDGILIGKALMEYNPKVFSRSGLTKGNIKYTIKVFVKEGRYKYKITDFVHDPDGNQYGKSSMGLITTEEDCPNPIPMAKKWSNKVWKDIKSQIENKILPLITDLKKGMTKQLASKKSDW